MRSSDKKALRKEYAELRKNIRDKELCDKKAFERLVSLDEYKRAEKVFCFVSYGSEIDTHRLIRKALEDNKRVAVPKIRQKHIMDFIYISSLSELEKNKYGILEPISDEAASSDDGTIIIVPGLVFDFNKNRLGYGGGFYDKYLSENKYSKSIGLCYDIQLLTEGELCSDKWDKALDMIVTEGREI